MAIGACGHQSAANEPVSVVVLGDSIVQRSVPDIEAELGDYDLRIAAFVGEGYGGGGFSDDQNGWWARDLARQYSTEGFDVAVVALGTNDALRPDVTPDETAAGVDQILGVWPDETCVVGVLPRAANDAPGYDQAEAAQVRAAVAEGVDVVVEYGYADDGDGIHPRWPDGVVAVGATIADGVRACP